MGQNPSWNITRDISLQQWNGGTPFPPESATFSQNRDPRGSRTTPRRVVLPPGRAQAAATRPSFPAAPRAPPATATAGRAHSHPSASSCRSSWSSERSAPRGEKKGPVSASGTLRAAPAARHPPSRPRGGSPRRRLRPGSHSGRRQTGGRGEAEAPPPPPPRHPENRGPRTRHLVVAPSSSVSRVSGATWSGASRGAGGRAREGRRGGGTGRRGRARGAGRGPGTGARAERLPDAGGGRAPGLAPPCPAAPCGSRVAGDPSSRLPHSRPGPAARAHRLGRGHPQAERFGRRRASCAAGPGPCGVCPGPGGASRGPARFIGSPASPTTLLAATFRRRALRGPAPPPQGCTYVGGDLGPSRGRESHPSGGGSAASQRAGDTCEVAGNKA